MTRFIAGPVRIGACGDPLRRRPDRRHPAAVRAVSTQVKSACSASARARSVASSGPAAESPRDSETST